MKPVVQFQPKLSSYQQSLSLRLLIIPNPSLISSYLRQWLDQRAELVRYSTEATELCCTFKIRFKSAMIFFFPGNHWISMLTTMILARISLPRNCSFPSIIQFFTRKFCTKNFTCFKEMEIDMTMYSIRCLLNKNNFNT